VHDGTRLGGWIFRLRLWGFHCSTSREKEEIHQFYLYCLHKMLRMVAPLGRMGAAARSIAALSSSLHSQTRSLSTPKVVAPPMVYISGEEMTHYASNLILEKWLSPCKWVGDNLNAHAHEMHENAAFWGYMGCHEARIFAANCRRLVCGMC